MKRTAFNAASIVLATFLMGPTAGVAGSQFKSPTGNIICSFAEHDNGQFGARCDIIESNIDFSNPLQPMPADCDVDWGGMFFTPGIGKSRLLCAGDLAGNPDEASVLDYGQVLKEGNVTCMSDKAGMTCLNGDGHGFTVSRNQQKLF
jgi:hypothetical protein